MRLVGGGSEWEIGEVELPPNPTKNDVVVGMQKAGIPTSSDIRFKDNGQIVIVPVHGGDPIYLFPMT